MSNKADDAGVIQVLLDRFNQQRLPRALLMKEKVDRGETLEKFEVDYLAEVLKDIQSIRGLVERHPEYQELVAKGINLYKEITEKAVANEAAK
ncbi:MAG: hypothetical protein KAX99_04220 [Azonexus sp.]|nr:hypothetical protein [Azonexus sp.]